MKKMKIKKMAYDCSAPKSEIDNCFEMFDKDGNLRPKDEILNDISNFYDSMTEPVFEEAPPIDTEQILEEFSFSDRCLYLYDEITEDYIHSLLISIKYWNWLDDNDNIPIDKRQPIKLYINTPGGDLNATLTIIDAITLSKTPVHTISVGKSYSGGFFIAISGHKRIGYPNSSYLFHEGYVCWESDAHKSLQHNEFYKEQLKNLKAIVLKNTKIPETEYKEHQRDDWWFNAQEALKYGIIDEITTSII